MSKQYDEYLRRHKDAVRMSFEWFKINLPALFYSEETKGVACEWQITYQHDNSKMSEEEYKAYDNYFYGENKSALAIKNFNKAWLHHIHQNPHHWQYWVLINDNPTEGEIIIDMPMNYIIEMLCDWWSFSWVKGDLSEVFSWYEDHKEHIKLSPATRRTVEEILRQMEEAIKTVRHNEDD